MRLAAVLFALGATSVAQCDDAKTKLEVEISATRPAQDMSREVIVPDDVPGHELAQRIYSYKVTAAKNPEFDDSTMLHFGRSDSINGSGSHNGYATWTLKSGDRLFLWFEGTQHRAEKGDKTTFEGKFTIRGGTGKYKNATGDNTYKGDAGGDKAFWRTTVVVTY